MRPAHYLLFSLLLALAACSLNRGQLRQARTARRAPQPARIEAVRQRADQSLIPGAYNADTDREERAQRSRPAQPEGVTRAVAPKTYVLADGVSVGAAIYYALDTIPQHTSLYQGLPESTFEAMAPHLFQYQAGSPAEQLWFGLARGRSWGLRIESKASLQELARHLQRYLLVDLQGKGQSTPSQVYLRFYDPRVMHTLLNALTPDQRREFFGPIDAFIVEHDAKKNEDVSYRLSSDGRLLTSSRMAPSQLASAPPTLPQAAMQGRIKYVREQLRKYGQLEALKASHSKAMPFNSICHCNEFKVERASAFLVGPSQHRLFSEHALRWYRERVFKSLRAASDQARAMSPEALRAVIKQGLKDARRYGMTSQFAVYTYIQAMVTAGSNFDQSCPAASQVLNDSSLSQRKKALALKERVSSCKPTTHL